MTFTPLESDGRAAASKAERAGSIPARGTARARALWLILPSSVQVLARPDGSLEDAALTGERRGCCIAMVSPVPSFRANASRQERLS